MGARVRRSFRYPAGEQQSKRAVAEGGGMGRFVNLSRLELLLIDMRTLKGAEWLEIAEVDWHWSPEGVCA